MGVFYGGEIPVKDGAYADIVVDKLSIEDAGFIRRLKRKSSHKFLNVGTEIMVALTIKEAHRIGSI